MLKSVPIIFQAASWPLIGALIILAAGRFLPGWLRRLIAVACALASLATFRTLAGAGADTFSADLAWDPINFFRMGLAFAPHGLSLLTGMALAGLTAAVSLSFRPSGPAEQHLPWHGLWLMALGGAVVMLMASNLVALSLGSGLLVVAVIALAMAEGNGGETSRWPPLSAAVPGMAATLLIGLAAAQADVQVGHASLLARSLPPQALTLVAIAGLLWILTFVVWAVTRPEQAVALLLPCGAGLYLLARTQAAAPVLGGLSWLPALVFVLLLGGGLLAWLNGLWAGLPAQQLGLATGFIWLLGRQLPAPVPWPSITLTLAVGVLAIWWHGSADVAPPAGLKLPAWLAPRIDPVRTRLQSVVRPRLAWLVHWRGSWLGRHHTAIWPILALASLAGFPLTAGGVGRWLFYGEALFRGQALVLAVVLGADVLVNAAAWAALWVVPGAAACRPVRLGSVVGMAGLAIPLVIWGLVPELLGRHLGLAVYQPVRVSPWGLGFLFALPWLAGAWLAASGIARRPLTGLEWLRRTLRTDWPQRSAAWLSGSLVGSLRWLGQVGEGEGWWGWALILLTLGALYLVAR